MGSPSAGSAHHCFSSKACTCSLRLVQMYVMVPFFHFGGGDQQPSANAFCVILASLQAGQKERARFDLGSEFEGFAGGSTMFQP
eukprot:1158203-Pelagomonas_calceolata.AAC.1